MYRAGLSVLVALVLAGCVETTSAPVSVPPAYEPTEVSQGARSMTVADFTRVVSRVEPVAERECRNRTNGANCDFRIVVENDPSAPANAWQTLDKSGRPVLTFTVALIAEVQNADELAFVMGHEAAHHISGHIARSQEKALTGALLGGVLIAAMGGDASAISSAQDIGATVGARSYSKSYELEADQLGTVIAYNAGYNPVRGAAYFTRIPDPGDKFLGSHPPNAQRIETVRRTMATL
ncbi:M48 family metallopeptidase [Celeribacter persicus]|jgi:Putative Zn-dependent protease, contains TPR repeats|uniref:Peptidase M48-like protein n=1 Tax=Celeribacter persicus TaxID=1651082 RepID=A0A2T5HVR0_9RHOB|nr:M48 family metallopeptidase [Celeribacter persicus]PTQ75666.1 peptidase M48-like protein [Celeribacter persicus]